MDRRVSYHCYLTFVLLICFASICGVSSNPVETSKPTMLQKIAVCETVNFVKNSSYVSKCSKLAYTTVLNEDDKDVAMCMVIYDITDKICTYNSQTSVNNKLKVPDSSQQFDYEVKKSEPKPEKSSNFIENFCKNKTTIFNRLHNIDIQSNSDVVPFVEYVNETLLKESECHFTCHEINKRVNSFCIFFWWASELFTNIKPIETKPNVEENLLDKQAPASITNTEKQTMQQNTKTVVIQAKKKTNSEPSNDTPVVVDKNTLVKPTEKSLPAADTKKQEVTKQQQVDASSGNKVVEEAKESEIQKQVDEVKEESMPLPGNEKTSSVASKVLDNNAESPNIVQPGKSNPEDFNSAEDPPIKKSDDADIEDANVRDSADDKDSMDDGIFAANNMGNPAEIPDNKKFYAHSSLVKEEDESHFFTYFSVLSLLCVGLYVGYHNKQKILAMVLEGRRSRRGRGSRRRPSTASYRKLDSNLEEAVTSQCNSNVTHVIY